MNNKTENPEPIEDIGTADPFEELISDIRNEIIIPRMVQAGLKVSETRNRFAKSNSFLKQTACQVALNPLKKWFDRVIPESIKKTR